MRVSFVSSYLSDFLIPPLNGLAGQCDLSALFLDETRSFDVDHRGAVGELRAASTVLSARRLQLDRSDLSVSVPRRTSKWLSDSEPDAVVVLSFVPEVWGAIAWARTRAIPSVMWSESTPWSGRLRSGVSQRVRGRVVRSVGAHLANGSAAEALLWELGVDRDSVVRSPFPVEAPPMVEPDESRDGDRPLRALFVGRLIPRKRPLDAIDAVNRLNARGAHRVELRILGDGPLGERVEGEARHRSAITWLGRAPRELVQESMTWADVIIVPSEREVWGLVVNEALHEGVFVVSTTEVASAMDLLPGDGSGVRYPVGDIDALVGILDGLAADLDRSSDARMRRARAAVAHAPAAYDPSIWAEAMMNAIGVARARSIDPVSATRDRRVLARLRRPGKHGRPQDRGNA